MNAPLSTAVATHVALREKLKAEFGLEDGEEALVDTLDGLSDLKELITLAARQARYEEAQADACKALIKDMQDRKARREAKAEKLRNAILWAMEDAGEPRIDAPDLTISLRKLTPSLIVVGEPSATSPAPYTKATTTFSWDKSALKQGVEIGDPAALEIAHFANQRPSLTIRTK